MWTSAAHAHSLARCQRKMLSAPTERTTSLRRAFRELGLPFPDVNIVVSDDVYRLRVVTLDRQLGLNESQRDQIILVRRLPSILCSRRQNDHAGLDVPWQKGYTLQHHKDRADA